jgi:hypothetical protein
MVQVEARWAINRAARVTTTMPTMTQLLLIVVQCRTMHTWSGVPNIAVLAIPIHSKQFGLT